MIFTATEVQGVFVVTAERHVDVRGWFARSYCVDEFAHQGIDFDLVQTSVSYNHRRGTLRGMHYQAAPAPEPKLVRCTRGRIFDVAVDLRGSSPTFCRWTSVELDPERGQALYIPPYCAHGFLTLEDSTEVHYSMGARHAPQLARGVRWDDAVFRIEWPFRPVVISERDTQFPDFVP